MFFHPADGTLELSAAPTEDDVSVGPVVGGHGGPSFFIGLGNAEVVHVRVHQVPQAPARLPSEAGEVVEFSCIGPGELSDPHVQGDSMPVIEGAGSHRVRLAVADGGGEELAWDFYVWPAPPSDPVVLREPDREARLDHLALPEAVAGLAGAARVGRDVDRAEGCRQLSGATGTAVVSRVCAGLPSKHRASFYGAHAWTFSADRVGWEFDQSRQVWYPKSSDHPDQLVGRTGMLAQREVTPLDAELRGGPKPSVVELEVAWLIPSSGVARAHLDPTGGLMLLAEPTLQSTTFRRVKTTDGAAATAITVSHSSLPVEWVHDMEAWWAFQLAIHDAARR